MIAEIIMAYTIYKSPVKSEREPVRTAFFMSVIGLGIVVYSLYVLPVLVTFENVVQLIKFAF